MAQQDVPLTQVAQGFAEALANGGPAKDYLLARGLSEASIKDAGLGVVSVPPEGFERFRGSISIPYRDASQQVAGLRFRHLNGSGNKYDQAAHWSPILYEIARTESDHVFITEGEFDTLVLIQAGFDAVGVPGAQMWKTRWRWLFRDSNRVTVVMDGDDPGRKASRKIASQLSRLVPVREVFLPAGHDVTSLYLEDPAQLQEILS